MNWGVVPTICEGAQSDEAKIAFAVEKAKEMGIAQIDDTLIVTSGFDQTTAGDTNTIRTLTVES